jgi:hypothetical protein
VRIAVYDQKNVPVLSLDATGCASQYARTYLKFEALRYKSEHDIESSERSVTKM